MVELNIDDLARTKTSCIHSRWNPHRKNTGKVAAARRSSKAWQHAITQEKHMSIKFMFSCRRKMHPLIVRGFSSLRSSHPRQKQPGRKYNSRALPMGAATNKRQKMDAPMKTPKCMRPQRDQESMCGAAGPRPPRFDSQYDAMLNPFILTSMPLRWQPERNKS